MGTLEYALVPGGRKRLKIQYTGVWETALVEVDSRAFAFHLHGPDVVNWTADDTVITTANGPARVLMAQSTVRGLEARGLKVNVLGGWDYFHVSTPTRAFLFARTRATVVERWVLAEISR